jgi:hypothetical protein
MAYTEPTARTLLWGGAPSAGDTWEWDGEGWVQVADTGPSLLVEYAGLVFDAKRNVAVLFTSNATNTAWETWEWDGTIWTQVDDTGPFAYNSLFRLVYDSTRAVTLLEGGSGPDVFPSAPPVGTWGWDGSVWTQLADQGPPQRILGALADDASRGRVVSFGGLDAPAINTGPPYGTRDTWEWDGSSWEQVLDFGPVARYGHGMVGTAGPAVLFGGSDLETDQETLMNDTWTWDGTYWRQLQDMGPSPRWLTAMSWDAARNRGVLFGGRQAATNLGDTWESFEAP